jgi:hypothetical protein
MTPQVDLPTFKGIKRFYSQDINVIYYKNTVVEDADRETFKEWDNHQAHDKNSLYSSGNKVKTDTTKTQ